MPRIQSAAALAAAALFVGACAPAERSEPEGPAIASLNGADIHQGDLDDWIRDELFADATGDKDGAALFEFRSQALTRMIEDQLVKAEMDARGVDLDGLRSEVVDDIAISDEEVARFYEQNQARIGEASLEQIAPRIRDFLEQQTRAQEWQRFVDGLRDGAEVAIHFEPPRIEVAATGPALGPENAPITIVEFSDFNCPFCQRVNPTLKALRERYPDEVRIVFRHYPLDRLHPRARSIAEASVCAAEQDLFWDFHDRVFADGTAMADDALRATAEASGLDLTAFDTCVADGRAQVVVERDLSDGAAAGVTGTPAFFVNGVRLSGAQPLEAFVDLIEKEIARGAETS